MVLLGILSAVPVISARWWIGRQWKHALTCRTFALRGLTVWLTDAANPAPEYGSTANRHAFLSKGCPRCCLEVLALRGEEQCAPDQLPLLGINLHGATHMHDILRQGICRMNTWKQHKAVVGHNKSHTSLRHKNLPGSETTFHKGAAMDMSSSWGTFVSPCPGRTHLSGRPVGDVQGLQKTCHTLRVRAEPLTSK